MPSANEDKFQSRLSQAFDSSASSVALKWIESIELWIRLLLLLLLLLMLVYVRLTNG